MGSWVENFDLTSDNSGGLNVGAVHYPKNKKEKNIVKEVMKIHDQLIPYESLTQAEKDKDLNLFLLLPLVQILKKSTNK